MRYIVRRETGENAYMQLYRQLKRDIVCGAYSVNGKLPSKRLLAEEVGVSVITVQHAYALLCEEGYAESRERSGYYVIYRESDFISVSDPLFESVRVENTHIPDTTIPFGVLAKTMRRVLSEKGELILVKSPGHGCSELRGAIASYLARSQGIYVTPGQIIVGSGSEYLYSLIAQLFGDRLFAIEKPSYEKIHRVYMACGIHPEFLSLAGDGIRSRDLSRTSATVLHVTPYNSFPSGISASASKKAEYLRWAKEREGYIIEDNYASELTVFAKNEGTLFAMSHGKRVIYLNTFSKTVAPSLRVGYMVLPCELLPSFEEKLGFYSCTVPVFEQYVLAHLLDGGDFERHVNRVRSAKRKERRNV